MRRSSVARRRCWTRDCGIQGYSTSGPAYAGCSRGSRAAAADSPLRESKANRMYHLFIVGLCLYVCVSRTLCTKSGGATNANISARCPAQRVRSWAERSSAICSMQVVTRADAPTRELISRKLWQRLFYRTIDSYSESKKYRGGRSSSSRPHDCAASALEFVKPNGEKVSQIFTVLGKLNRDNRGDIDRRKLVGTLANVSAYVAATWTL